jgi:DNA-binding CsgD family transcriptional regulator
MNKVSTSSLEAQDERMAIKRQSQQMVVEAINGAGMSPWEARELVQAIEEVYFTDPQLRPHKDGQMRMTCVAATEGAGKPLEQCRKVPVVLTLFDDEDERELYSHVGSRRTEEIRQRRLCRLTDEAREQGGLLTQEDLARYLMCSVRTVRRDIDALKKVGVVVPTRGQQKDIGPTVTHRALAVSKWLEGKEPVEIARAIKHSIRSVERYLESFKRIAWLCGSKAFSVFEAALAVGVSVSLARLCHDLMEEYKDSTFLQQRMAEIELVGTAFYIAQDEKKLSTRASESNSEWMMP